MKVCFDGGSAVAGGAVLRYEITVERGPGGEPTAARLKARR